MAIVLNPDPASTYGASDEYKAAWAAAYGFMPAPANSVKPYYGSVVTTAQSRWRSEFNVWPSDNWSSAQTGSGGMSASIAGGILSLSSGVNAGDTLSVTGNGATRMVSVPSRVAFGIKMSQKIANFELFIELVALNDDNSLDETVVAAWKFAGSDAAAVTSARWEVRNGVGTAGRTQSPDRAVPALTSDLIAEIQIEADECWLHMRPMDATTQRSNSYTSQKTAPDPTRRYVPRIRLVNGNTNPTTGAVTPAAPASATTVSVYYVTGSDYTDMMTEITGGSGDSVTGRAVPVAVTNSIPTQVTSSRDAPLTVTTVEDMATEVTLRRLLHAASYAKDTSDQMRVTVANQPTQSNVWAGNTNALLSAQVIPPASTNAWNAHDIREEYRELSHQSFSLGPRVRWQIT